MNTKKIISCMLINIGISSLFAMQKTLEIEHARDEIVDHILAYIKEMPPEKQRAINLTDFMKEGNQNLNSAQEALTLFEKVKEWNQNTKDTNFKK